MNRRKKSRSRPSSRKRKPYRAPALTVHGDIRALTGGGGGNRADGTGNPKTMAAGGHP